MGEGKDGEDEYREGGENTRPKPRHGREGGKRDKWWNHQGASFFHVAKWRSWNEAFFSQFIRVYLETAISVGQTQTQTNKLFLPALNS